MKNFIEIAKDFVEKNTNEDGEFVDAVLNLMHEFRNNGEWFKKINLKDGEAHRGTNKEYCDWQKEILSNRGFRFLTPSTDMTVDEYFNELCKRALTILNKTIEKQIIKTYIEMNREEIRIASEHLVNSFDYIYDGERITVKIGDTCEIDGCGNKGEYCLEFYTDEAFVCKKVIGIHLDWTVENLEKAITETIKEVEGK